MQIRTATFCILALWSLCIITRAAPPKPEGYVRQWTIIGPFPNPERAADSKDRGAFDVDYLAPLGGESKAKIGPNTAIGDIKAQAAKLDGSTLDFCAHYTDTDHKLAYAYTELESPSDQEAFFLLGSDDGVKVWVNGKLAHENLIQRPAGIRQDRFKVKLHKGTNSVLAKVENGLGDWGLILEVYGGEQGRKIEAEIKAEENAKAFQREDIVLANRWPGYIFWTGWLGPPTFVWRHVDRVKELEGDIPLTVRWFDSSLNEVKAPDKTGRYMVLLQGKMRDGTPVRRAATLFCDPPEGGGLESTMKVAMPYPGKPFDSQGWAENAQVASSDSERILRDALVQTEEGAMLLAALYEARPTGAKATVTESAKVRHDDYQLALKLKLAGLTNEVRPLDPPKKLDSSAEVLHEGTPTEAGVKPDAKEKIDAVCRQWAEDSGEPFTILVARHGVIVAQAAFGKKPDGTPVDLDYRTDVMSITKAITGMLFSRFMDQGYVKLDEPIGNRVPGFPTKGEHMLTYRHLFTHTSGLEGHGEWGGIHNPYLDNVVLDGLDYIHPGRAHIYNGMGYDLAAKAMEYMTGKSIVRLFHDDLFRPLGINDVPVDDCAFGGHFTAYELGILGQCLANHGRYGDKQFISEETFKKLLPEPLKKYYPAIDLEWGIGLTWFRETRPESKDLIFGEHVIGHGSASSCILRVDLDHDLVITQIRKTAGDKYGEYAEKFFMTIADGMVDG
jgi:CubicO group peptidase (beta-lactamase class C family)